MDSNLNWKILNFLQLITEKNIIDLAFKDNKKFILNIFNDIFKVKEKNKTKSHKQNFNKKTPIFLPFFTIIFAQ